jgi:hypothetical protein
MKKTLSVLLGLSTVAATFAFALVVPAFATTPNWNTTGDYVVTMEYLGSDYDHDMTLVQDEIGNLTGNGGSPAGSNTYLWNITSGTVAGDSIEFTANYTATPDAVTPQTTMDVEGTIAEDGTMSGTWSDNYSGGERSGTWTTASGEASEMVAGTLAAEDFGVVSYDTGMGMLSGYTAGFGLTDATFAGAQSVVVELYSGATLLQTNTAILPKFNADITGTQFSTPFDVSGTFDYATDGYWVNEKESEYGQSVPATKVVATVTLANGKIVTAMNTTLVGDPETIYGEDDSETVTVTIKKFVQGVMATGVSANNADFPMTATWDAENVGAGTGSYALSETNTTPYQAETAEMTEGADYETKEMVNGSFVGAQCATGKPFALQGYTVGNTHAEAMAASPSMAMPSFTNLRQDKYVIVWNRDCALPEVPAGGNTSGEIGGEVIGDDVELEVTSIEMIDTTATANGSFTDGWEYVFHITAPMSEENLAMKFSDWLRTGGGGTIPTANNMRISSLQANNGGATILLTAANVYSTPDLTMTGDLDLVMAGRQVEITVEVAIPNGTPNGAYATSYGVRSNP